MQRNRKLTLKIHWKMLYSKQKTSSQKKIPSLSKYCDKQLLWLEQNPEASVEEYQTKMKEVQDWISAEVQKNGGMPQGKPQNPPEPTKPSNMPDIDEID